MITNTDMMLDKDAEAEKLLELCMVRMPNQNLSLEDARQVLEFQRSNDGEK
jgi:DNA-binding transcriptional regulator WhiA